MFRGFFILRIIFTLFILAILVGGGLLLFRAGYTSGFNAAALANHTGSSTITPNPYYGYWLYGPTHGFGFFFPGLGLLFGIGAIFLMLFIIGGFFRMLAWRHWGAGPNGQGFRPQHRHGHWDWNWKDDPEPQAGTRTGPGEPPTTL